MALFAAFGPKLTVAYFSAQSCSFFSFFFLLETTVNANLMNRNDERMVVIRITRGREVHER